MSKQLVYRSRCLNQSLTFNGIMSEIETVYYIEKYNVVVQEKFDKHQKRWSPLTGEICQSSLKNTDDYIEQYFYQINNVNLSVLYDRK